MRNVGNRLTWAMCVLLLSAVFASAAYAQDRRVKVINETDFTVVEFYGSNAGTNQWEEDVLGSDVLYSGQSVIIDFDDGTGYCRFDFLARFDDGDEVQKQGIDVCETSVFRLTQ